MQILGPDRYNPEKLKELEADVLAQADAKTAYNSDVNFTVLRIYQFYPTYANASVVQKILLMGLMRAPSTDFSVYLHMLSETLQKDDPIPALAELGKSLACCGFAEFWAGVDKLGSAVFGQAKGFDDTVRVAIVSMLAVSHSVIPLDMLMASLDLKDEAAVKTFMRGVDNKAWTWGAGGLEVATTGQSEVVHAVSNGGMDNGEVVAFDRLAAVFDAKPLTSRP